MGDTFREMTKQKKLHRANMLAKADTTGWTQHTEYHYSRIYNNNRIDWWPSSGKAQYKSKMIYGHNKVNKLIKDLNNPKESIT